jgi:cellulose synthase/poly-beta-1,6-N-acetylglucosamine synthase-like glycosyltransferase
MTLICWIVLWASLLALLWVYVLHPILLWLSAPPRQAPVPPPADLPGVSLILAVHNEAAVIRRKLDNCMALEHPAKRLEIIVISDGSTDGTDAILSEYAERGVRILIPGERLGKTEAQNRGVAVARHPILFFTDATTVHPPDVLRLLVPRFSDPGVGCVSGRSVFHDDRSLTSTGLQMKQWYDRVVRTQQARSWTLFGATGCVYAVRRDLYVPLRPDLVSDFVEPLKLLAAGYRTVYEPAAIGMVDRRAPDPRQEFSRRSRIVLQGFRAVFHMRELLSPRRGVLQAISLATQRPLKWLTPFYALGALSGSLFLRDVPVVGLLLILQLVFYGVGLVSWGLERLGVRVPRSLALPLYFSITSLAALAGMARLLRGETGQSWKPACR